MNWVVAALFALWGLATGLLVPDLIRRIPEPEPDEQLPDDEEGAVSGSIGGSDDAGPAGGADGSDHGEPPKELYADIAALRGLRAGSAVAAAVVAGLIGGRLGWGWDSALWAFLTPIGVALAVIDWRTHLLPTRIVAPTYVGVLAILVAASIAEGDTHGLVHAGYGWAIAGGIYLLLWIVNPRGLGYGDVRLSGVLGLALGFLGWGQLWTGLFLGFLLGGLGGVILTLLRIIDRKENPFGPFMLVGALAGVLFGADIAAWYAP